MKERTKILRDTILQRDVELTVLRVVCTESAVRLSSIEEQLDYAIGQQKKHTIAFQCSPLQEYINKVCSSLSPHLHNGEWFLQVARIEKLGSSIWAFQLKSKWKNASLVGLFLDGDYGQGPFWGLDGREIKIWCPIEWAILGKKFLVRGIVPQEPWDIWDERCTSLHWDPSGRPYEGWIQCY